MALRNSQQSPFRHDHCTLEEGAAASRGQDSNTRPSHQRMTTLTDAYAKLQGMWTAIGLVLCGIILLGFAADLSWGWGIFVALADLAVAPMVIVHFRRERAKMTDKVLEDEDLSAKTARRFNAKSVLQIAGSVLCSYTLVLILIQISCRSAGVSFASVIDSETGFPIRCPENALNCVRLGMPGKPDDSYMPDGLETPTTGGSVTNVEGLAKSILERSGAQVVWESKSRDVLRVRFVTTIMGYIDDLACHVRCTPAGTVTLMQSQSRIGVGDLGANSMRMARFVKELKAECGNGTGAASKQCTGSCKL